MHYGQLENREWRFPLKYYVIRADHYFSGGGGGGGGAV